jgi:uncharacterized protein YecT (DUF1311 family)
MAMRFNFCPASIWMIVRPTSHTAVRPSYDCCWTIGRFWTHTTRFRAHPDFHCEGERDEPTNDFSVHPFSFIAKSRSRICAVPRMQRKAAAQVEMNACASQEAARVDAELNAIYRKLLAITAAQPEAVARIRAAERAWIAYRNAFVLGMYPASNKLAEYGSMYPMEADLLRARLTRRQIDALWELVQQYRN